MAEPHICELSNFPKDKLKEYQERGRATIKANGRRKKKNLIKNKMLRAMEGNTWRNL